MRNLLALLGAAVLIFAAVGWYLGWYTIRTNSESTGRDSTNIEIHNGKIEKDLHKGEEKLKGALHSADKQAPANNDKAGPAKQEPDP